MAENVQLTEQFFQEFVEDPNFAVQQPTLQIIQARSQTNNELCFRLRASDGIFSYTNVGFAKELLDRCTEDGVEQPDRFPVIKVLDYSVSNTSVKPTMTINDYELVAIDIHKIGNPVAHTGDPEAFKGYKAAAATASAKRQLPSVQNNEHLNHTPKRAKTEGEYVLPIKAITPFLSGKWRINGVVTDREELREVQSRNGKGPMKVFNFTLADRNGSSIRIAAFGETATKTYPLIEPNVSYYITGTTSNNCIRAANKKFNNTGHDYEISLNHECVIERAEDQSIEAPKFILKKIPIAQLSSHVNQAVDVLGVIEKVEDLTSLKTKDNRDLVRRNVHLIDSSASTIHLTLWGDTAIHFGGEVGQAIGVRGAFVKDFNGSISLSVNSGTRMEINPDSPETSQLLDWFSGERMATEIKSLSTQGGTATANFAAEGRAFAAFANPSTFVHYDRGIYFNDIAMIASIRHDNAIYKACITNECQKKVVETDNKFYRCDKCYKTHNTFKYRYMVQMELADGVSTGWVTLFDDKATAFFGKTADEMGALKESDNNAYTAIFNEKLFTFYNFRLRAKHDNWQDTLRLRYQSFDMRAPNYEKYVAALDETINRLENI